VHYFVHLRDELLEDFFLVGDVFCLVGDDFICDQLRQRNNALQPIEKARGQLVILVLFLQELNPQALFLPLVDVS